MGEDNKWDEQKKRKKIKVETDALKKGLELVTTLDCPRQSDCTSSSSVGPVAAYTRLLFYIMACMTQQQRFPGPRSEDRRVR